MMSPGAFVPVTEYVTWRGPARVVVVGGGAAELGGSSGGGGAGSSGAGAGAGGGSVTVTVSGGGGGGSSDGGGGGGGGGVVVVISSCTGGAVVVVDVGPPCALRLSDSVPITSNDTDTTREMAAMMATTPTTHGQRGGLPVSTSSVLSYSS